MSDFIKTILILVLIIGFIIFLAGKIPEFFRSHPLGDSSFLFRQSSSSNYIVDSFSRSRSYASYTYDQIGTSYLNQTNQANQTNQTNYRLSPYYGKVRLGSFSVSSFSSNSQIQISSLLATGEIADITGWRIKGKRGDVVIPSAINLYDPAGLTPDQDIIISANASVNIYGGTSAIGRNLRLNKCIGYLGNSNNFNPNLPTSCPAPFRREEVTNLTGFCQDKLLSLGSCRLPSVSMYNSLPANNDGNICREYLSQVNYSSCYNKHINDSDFTSNTWMVWVGGQINFDNYHDNIVLLDKNGFLVSQYSY